MAHAFRKRQDGPHSHAPGAERPAQAKAGGGTQDWEHVVACARRALGCARSHAHGEDPAAELAGWLLLCAAGRRGAGHPTFATPASFEAWLRAARRNMLRKSDRSEARHRAALERLAALCPPPQHVCPTFEDLPSEAAARCRAIEGAILERAGSLDERAREVGRLLFGEEHEPGTVQRELGFSKSTLYRERDRVLELLIEVGLAAGVAPGEWTAAEVACARALLRAW